MKINVKEKVNFVLRQTGELIELEKGIYEEDLNLRLERIISQSNGKIEIVKEEIEETAGDVQNQGNSVENKGKNRKGNNENEFQG